jgi:fructokinase
MSDSVPHILGEVLFDCFPDGVRVLGGAPFNVAWHLAAFGQDPLFRSAVGEDDAGHEILARMKAHGMRLDGVQRHPSLATGRVEVRHAASSPEYHFPEDSAWDAYALGDIPPIPPPSLLYQGSLFLRRETSREASLRLAAEAACPRFVDVNLRAPWYTPKCIRKLVTGITYLKVSEEELGLLGEWFALPAERDLAALARALLREASVGHAFVTRGPEGALWISDDGTVLHAPPAVVERFVDSVGAGDASAAVAILGLLEGWPLPLLLERAMEFAAAICGIHGAIPKNPGFYHEFIKQWT